MATAGSGKVNEEIRTDRKSCSRTRSRDPGSNHRHDNKYKERRDRDKPSQERIPPSQRSSSPSSSSSLDSRHTAESRPRPTLPSIIYHAKSRKDLRSCSHSSHDRSRSDKRGHRDNQNQGSKTGERNASEERSLIWLSEHRGWKVSWSKLPLTWGFPTRFLWMLNLDQVASLRGMGLH